MVGDNGRWGEVVGGGGRWWEVDLQLGHVDALARLERAALDDGAGDLSLRDAAEHLNLHQAVVEEQGHARLHALDQRRLLDRRRQGDAPRPRQVVVVHAQAQLDRGASLKRHRLVTLGHAAAELGALDVAEDLDLAAGLASGLANPRDELLELARPPVRRVETEDVCTCVCVYS